MAILNEQTTVGGIEVYPFLQGGGGTNSSILSTLNKLTDYAVVSIGNSSSGLTANDVDYLISSQEDIGNIISTAITNNIERNRSRDVIILIYPGMYTMNSSITYETTDFSNGIYLYGIGTHYSNVAISLSASLSSFLNIDFLDNIYIRSMQINVQPDYSIVSKIFSVTNILDIKDVEITGVYQGELYLFDIVKSGTKIKLDNVNINVYSEESYGTPATYLLLHNTMNGDGTSLTVNNCNFEDSSSSGFQWMINSNDNIDIRNSKFNLQTRETSGTIFTAYNSLTLINNDFLDNHAVQQTSDECYLLTVSSSHDRLVILNNIMRKDYKAGTLMSTTSENNLKDSDIYDFNIIVER